MSDELKPCTHCGQLPAKPVKKGGSDERYGYNFTMTIACRCGAEISRKSSEDKQGWCSDVGEAEAEVIAAWNRRATPPASEQARDAALEEAAALLDSMHANVSEEWIIGFERHDGAHNVLTNSAKRIRALKSDAAMKARP